MLDDHGVISGQHGLRCGTGGLWCLDRDERNRLSGFRAKIQKVQGSGPDNMPTMSRYRNCPSGRISVVFTLAALLVGCGSSSDDNALSAIDFGKSTLASCLKANDATFADSINDLTFLSRAEAEDTASLFGSAYDYSAKLFVDLWEDGDDPREWLMWSAQPFEEDKSPFEIVETASSGSYVAYALRPTAAQRKALEECTD